MLEEKYIMLASPMLDRFVRKDDTLYNFRCPFCGDSEKSKAKARGYLLYKDGKYVSYCHNCYKSYSFPQFLKQLSTVLYGEYIMEKYQENPFAKKKEKTKELYLNRPKVPDANKALLSLKKISALPADHFAKAYVVSRKIPTNHHHRLYYTENFKAWTNKMVPDKFKNTDFPDARLVIPFLDKDGILFGYQGRSLDPTNKVRYITIMLDESKPRIFGLDRVNLNTHFWVVEGPIDSLFIPNCIATAGGKIQSELKGLHFEPSNCTVFYDNEPRNKEVIQSMEDCANRGYRVAIWPSSVSYKDINEMVLAKVPGDGIDTERIELVMSNFMRTMRERSYQGLQALLEIRGFRKC